MLLVNASPKPSMIDGIGLFANEDIPKGTTTWQFDSSVDIILDPLHVAKLPDIQRKFIETYAYLSKKQHKYILSIDASMFTNHSSKHNNIDHINSPDESEPYSITNREIKKGEELLINYRSIDPQEEDYLDS